MYNSLNVLFVVCSFPSQGARAQWGGRAGGAAEGLGVSPQRRLPHVHLQPPAALLGLLRLLTVGIRQRKKAQTHKL